MFAPVTKETFRLGAIRPTSRARSRSRSAAPRRPVFVEIPTDLLSAREAALGRRRVRARGRAPTSPTSARRSELLAGAWKPLVWAGGGAVDAGPRGGRAGASASARRSSPRSRARGLVGAEASAARSACRRTAGGRGAVGRGRRGDRDRHRPRRHEHHELAAAAAAAAVGGQRRSRATRQELRAGCAGRGRRGARAARAGRRPAAAASTSGPTSSRSAAARAARCAATIRSRSRFLDAFARAVPDDVVVVADMCIPGYWLAGMHTPAGAAPLPVPDGLGDARLRASRRRSARRWPAGPTRRASRGDGGFLFALRRAGDGEAGAACR